MNAMTLPRNNCAPARQTGLSLVELMISLTIGLVLLLGISTLIVQQNSTRIETEKSSRQIENGRYAVQLLHDDIQLAGFYGDYSPASGVIWTTPDPCDTTDNTANLGTTGNLGWNNSALSVPVAIFGYAGAGADPTPSSCLDNYKPNTAVLVIRRASTVSNPVASAVANTTFLQVSRCFGVTTPFVLATSGYTLRQRDCVTLAELRPYIVRIYYISSCSVCGVDTIPTLKMVEFVGGARNPVPLVEGIDNMQFDYGVDTGTDGAPDIFTTAPASWASVMAVRVNLLARNNEITANYNNTNTYNLGGAGIVGPFNDTYNRHAFSQLVRATNPSGRRE